MNKFIGVIYFISIFSFLNAEDVDDYYAKQKLRLSSSDVSEIRDAIDRLTFISGSRGVRDIITTLEGNPNFPSSPVNSAAVKFYAAKALAKKGEVIAIQPLIKVYKKESLSFVERTEVKQTLGGVPKTNTSLSSPYFFGENEHTMVLACGEILRALGSIPTNEESLTEIKNALQSPNFYIRSSAADALFFIGNKDNIQPLTDQLGKENDPYAKISILSSILGLEKMANQNFRSVTESLKDANPEIRKKASEALGRFDLSIAAPYLEKAIRVENHPFVLKQMKEDYQKITSFHVP
ncbi:HEAT repeat domain-containing protein [Leptospira sp. 96542]|nr:HEAT repeat domain-containing protein [Leptospira sp. 96542]